MTKTIDIRVDCGDMDYHQCLGEIYEHNLLFEKYGKKTKLTYDDRDHTCVITLVPEEKEDIMKLIERFFDTWHKASSEW